MSRALLVRRGGGRASFTEAVSNINAVLVGLSAMERPMSFDPATRLHFEKVLGYTFDSPALLVIALTLPSRARELGVPCLKALANVGDKTLAQVLVAQRVRHGLDVPKGELTEQLKVLVSNLSLAEIAKRLDLQTHLRRGNCERYATLSARQLGDALEALIGAVFLDSGYASARRVVLRLMS